MVAMDMLRLVWVALACAAISFTITTNSIFKWFREPIAALHPKLDELVHCPWCFGHYVMLVFLIPYRKGEWYDWIVSWFAMVCIMGLVHYVLLRTYQPTAEAALKRKLEKLNKKDS